MESDLTKRFTATHLGEECSLTHLKQATVPLPSPEILLRSESMLAPVGLAANTQVWSSEQVKDRLFWFKGFRNNKKGGLIFEDKEILRKQQGVVKDVMKQLGSQLLSGKLAVRLSLPIRLFEPRSLLERVAESWCYAPTLLTKAANIHADPVERMKFVVSFVVAGLHCCVNQQKPFNPILGETYQSTFVDGTSIYLEHVK